MPRIISGDRVQIRCASALSDGTNLESSEARETPYWIRAGASAVANGASEAVLGMQVGERKLVVVAPPAARKVTLDIEVVAIKARCEPS
jgi:FKBP-type peptidyl-prolyl cis-trans isomerase